MADTSYQPQTRTGTEVQIDQGLRSYMLKVYNYMGAGLAITGAAAYGTFQAAVDASGALTPFGETVFVSPLKWVLILAPLAMVFFLSFRIHKMSVSAAQLTFWAYAALVGVSFASLGLIYTSGSIAQVFFITAGTFGALSLYGYTTKRDLVRVWLVPVHGAYRAYHCLAGQSVFLKTRMFSLVLSAIGVLVFTGLTAWDTQQIKEMYYEADDVAVMGRKAIMGALRLYLDFINLFLSLLRIFGNRE